MAYIIDGMDMFDIEVEPEVRAWLESLSDEHYGRAMYRAKMLAESAGTLGEPYSRHLDGKFASCDSASTAVPCVSRTGWHLNGVSFC